MGRKAKIVRMNLNSPHVVVHLKFSVHVLRRRQPNVMVLPV